MNIDFDAVFLLKRSFVMKRNIFGVIWGVASFICLFVASYKSFALEIKEINDKPMVYVNGFVETKQIPQNLKVLKISIGNREKMAMLEIDGQISTFYEGMNITEEFKLTNIFKDHIVVTSNEDSTVKFSHFLDI